MLKLSTHFSSNFSYSFSRCKNFLMKASNFTRKLRENNAKKTIQEILMTFAQAKSFFSLIFLLFSKSSIAIMNCRSGVKV